ncbi:YceK/YidQ family lipoprotein [Noviherbaspirillum massiliense]|uniref:YceK/YidQ family lipoprotein n=1 Tax=Noviherbaspirillum massiliense TaxID=1465823 RepID=UPI00035DBCCB
MRDVKVYAIAIFIFTNLCGCVSVGTLVENKTPNKIYSGTRRHIEARCMSIVCADLPFSLVADTLLLPVTVPWTLVDFYTVDASSARQSTALMPAPRTGKAEQLH